jgi:hypothetical protein
MIAVQAQLDLWSAEVIFLMVPALQASILQLIRETWIGSEKRKRKGRRKREMRMNEMVQFSARAKDCAEYRSMHHTTGGEAPRPVPIVARTQDGDVEA